MRRRTLLQTSSAGAMLIVGIAVMLNLFAHFAHFRLDFSAGKIYSMSSASKRVLRSLPDPVVVKLFYSKELPPQVAVNRDYARDLLSEYRSASGGKVRVQLVTETGPESKEEAGREGIAIVRFDVIQSDRREQRDGFLGISIQYREKKEVLPFLQDVTGLEYDLTSRIKTMTAPAKPALAFITNHRATGPLDLEPGVKGRLESRFELKSLDLASAPDDGIPPDIQTALWIGPSEKLTERELWLLDQYLASGRSLGVALDTKRVDMRNFFATDNETGLPELLAKHGVRPLSTIVLDRLSQPIQLSMQQGFLTFVNTVEYPPFVIARDLSKDHIITRDLEGLVVPFASPLEVSASGKLKAEVLLRTTKQSWAKPDKTTPIMLHPLQLSPQQPGDLSGPFALAVAVEGEFQPAFPAPPKGVKAKAPLDKAAKPGRLAVIGTSRIMAQEFRVPAANYVFMLNLMDWLALDADLIAIRSKTVGFRPLKDLSDSRKALVRYSLIFGPSLLVVGLGLLQWRRRGAARARRVAEFGTPPPPASAEAPREPPVEAAPVSREAAEPMRPKVLAKPAAVFATVGIATLVAALLTRPPGPRSLATESLAGKIDRVEVEHPEGTIELVKEKTGWVASRPKGYPADGRTIDEILTRLPRTRVSEPLTEDPERYAMFGFGASSATHAKLYAGKSSALDFYVGKAGTDYPSAFLRLAKESGVVQVLGLAPNDWARAPGDWLDKKIVGGLAEGVTEASVKGPKASWELKQSSAGWTIGGKRVPPENVEHLVRQARETAAQLEADGVLEAAAAPKDTGLDKPEMTVRVQLKTGPVAFYVGKLDGSSRRYVRKEGEERVIFVVADWKLEPLRKPAAAFLAKP